MAQKRKKKKKGGTVKTKISNNKRGKDFVENRNIREKE